ncbi:endogenous retrovirus group FC1 Env polyprotein [Nannospalax galili]|uniref:endogenous retrovirus group FC1 Env polyprotein n=1 Tax=Nannospalax galili TaxID=1026970 RepID=UPI000819B489|nr:endogenous retrovirus group FC1 Env polyprotein [Nannospalax galili]
MIIPQVYLFKEEKAARLLHTCQRREIFIPLLVGLGLALSLGARGAATAAIVQTHHLAGNFRDKLNQAMASMTDSLESLQRQMNSLAGVVLQNRKALDLITAEHGGTCIVLGKECCFFVNESNIVMANVNTLKKLRNDLLSRFQPTEQLSWFSNHLFSWLLPSVSPLIMLCVLMLAPCFIQFLR